MAVERVASPLWILGGILFMLPGILGNDRVELIPIGIALIVIGVAVGRRGTGTADSSADE